MQENNSKNKMANNLTKALRWTGKRLPGVSLYYYLSGEFAPVGKEGEYSQRLIPAAKHVLYAGATIAALTFGYLGPEMDKQLNQQNSQAQVEMTNK